MRWNAFISRHNNITYDYYKCADGKSQAKREATRFAELVSGIKISWRKTWAHLFEKRKYIVEKIILK